MGQHRGKVNAGPPGGKAGLKRPGAAPYRRERLQQRTGAETAMPFQTGLLLFPNLTQLDMTGPYEVFAKFPDSEVHLLWKTLGPVTAAGGMRLLRARPSPTACSSTSSACRGASG